MKTFHFIINILHLRNFNKKHSEACHSLTFNLFNTGKMYIRPHHILALRLLIISFKHWWRK